MSNKKAPAKEFSMSKWQLFFCGICMGAADLVPGISGGTIAFIMGFYYQLLESVKTVNAHAFKLLVKGQFKACFNYVAWPFLLTLLAGIFCSFIALAGCFHFILEHEVYRVYLYSAFLGLILASFWFCIREIHEWRINEIGGLLIGVLVAYSFTSASFVVDSKGPYAVKIAFDKPLRTINNYQPEQQLLTNLTEADLSVMLAKGTISPSTEIYQVEGGRAGIASDFINTESHTYKIDTWLILCGMIAVCALLLPGISGSYFLTLLGVYPKIIESLADFTAGLRHFTFDADAFYVLFSLGIGVIAGLLIFAKFVSWLLKAYPSFTIATLSGFMLGALPSVWPFWSYTYTLLPSKIHKGPQLVPTDIVFPAWDSPLVGVAIGFTVLGFGIVFLVEYLAKQKEQLA